jgi:hypothetical protein
MRPFQQFVKLVNCIKFCVCSAIVGIQSGSYNHRLILDDEIFMNKLSIIKQ